MIVHAQKTMANFKIPPRMTKIEEKFKFFFAIFVDELNNLNFYAMILKHV
jgi:hypothetical protein